MASEEKLTKKGGKAVLSNGIERCCPQVLRNQLLAFDDLGESVLQL
jgi:hypothetical protein